MNNKPNNMKNRQRGRNGGGGGKPRPMGGGGGPNRNPNYDGNNMRPRGNAQQLMEKFLAMARDASAMGDRVAAENYFQHADHYYRVLNARFEQQQQNNNNPQNGQRRDQGPRGYDRHGNEQGNEQGDDMQSGGQGYDRQDYNRPNQDYNRPNQDYNRPNQDRQNYGNQGYTSEGQQTPQEPQPVSQPYQPASVYQPPQPAVVSPPDSEIGLPPGILGMDAPVVPQAPAEPAFEAGAEDGRAPRRRRGRGHGGPRGTGPEPSTGD